MKVLDLKNNIVIISPESLTLKCFNTLWIKDKTKNKDNATKDITYIYHMVDFNSPFSIYPFEDRSDIIKTEVINMINYKPDKDTLKALEFYKEYQIDSSPSLRVFEAANIAVSKMEEFFRNVNYNEDDIDKVQKAIINMPKMQEALNQAKEICMKEKVVGVKNRGNYKISQFED